MDITKLQGVIPDIIYDEIQNVTDNYEINVENRLAHFPGQYDHESGEFKAFLENLNYNGHALWVAWPKHFASEDEANQFARQPEKIANRVYANRNGNGDEDSGDGWRYRDKGCVQLTGKTNQVAFLTSVQQDPGMDKTDIIATDYPLVGCLFLE
jgi:putative chitinase